MRYAPHLHPRRSTTVWAIPIVAFLLICSPSPSQAFAQAPQPTHSAKGSVRPPGLDDAVRAGTGRRAARPSRVRFRTSSADCPDGACWRPYSASSPFNTALAAGTALAPDSAQIVQSWLATWSSGGSSTPRFAVGNADSREDYDHPVYYGQPGDPTYTVHCAESWGRCPVEGMQIHVPGAASPAGGSDGHMAVIDQSSGWEYDFWQVRQKPEGGGTLTVSWGGRTRIDGEGLGSPATAANFGLAAGIIRPQELAAGRIDHALFMVVKCTNGRAVWPAASNSGRSCASMGLSDANAPAMGQHFFLDMSEAQIDALAEPAWQRTILRAMARYGLYVGDTGGGFLKIESGSSYTSFGLTDPWVGIAREAGLSPWHDGSTGKDVYTFDLSKAVDWAGRLKVAAG